MRLSVVAAAATLGCRLPAPARGAPTIAMPPPPPPIDQPVIVHAPAYQIQLIALRFTYFDQDGLGYQSAAGPASGPGSERTTIAQPQNEVVATLGDRLTERIVTSLDVITAASPNHKLYGLPVGTPVDVISSPSRINEAGQIDSDTTYAWSRTTSLGVHADYHLEEPLESWGLGMFATHSFADDNTVLSASLFQIVDWFDYFNLDGKRYRPRRAHHDERQPRRHPAADADDDRPRQLRLHDARGDADQHLEQRAALRRDARHGDRPASAQPARALGAVVQWLPWQGALRLGYRFYADSWGSVAHTVDTNVSSGWGG